MNTDAQSSKPFPRSVAYFMLVLVAAMFGIHVWKWVYLHKFNLLTIIPTFGFLGLSLAPLFVEIKQSQSYRTRYAMACLLMVILMFMGAIFGTNP
jgi:hypothetical protein